MTMYKTMNGTAGSYGFGEWSLPVGKRPGKWMPPMEPVLCESGYHVCRNLSEVLRHSGPELYEVEVRGTFVEGEDKAAYEQARLLRRIPEWNERNLRHLACDCAESAVQYAQAGQRELLEACIAIARAYADWPDEWAAALAAAWDAAWAAAGAAAWYAAGAAAGAAAWAAAWDTAWDAARAAAWYAARDAAWDAARAAAWYAARDAAWAAQVANLVAYLDGTSVWCEKGAS